MRIFLIWAASYSHLNYLISSLRTQGHQLLYWVGVPEGKTKRSDGQAPNLPGVVFHNHFDAFADVPAPGIDVEQFPPLDRKFIESFARVESIALTMMNKYYNSITVDERKHIYYNMLRYWNGILNKHKPEVIIFRLLPHSVYNYIIYELARYLGIKTLMFEPARARDRLLMFSDWRQGSLTLRKELEQNKGRNFALSVLSRDLQEYYNAQRNPRADVTPLDLQWHRKEYSLKNTWRKRLRKIRQSLCDGSFLSNLSGFVLWRFAKWFKPNLKKEYTSLQIDPDLNRPFVYTPLGFQPEETSGARAVAFADQILMVETIANALPDGWLVYVKEHPVQWWRRGRVGYSSSRYQGYYERLAKIKNVCLLPIKTDNYTLINKSRAVAVVTGTASWEALLRSKPALIFGYPWYRDCPGLFRVEDVDSCKQAFNKIVNGFKPNQQDIINYLYCLDKASIKADITLGKLAKNFDIGAQESKEKMAAAVIAKLKELSIEKNTSL